jgi:hypothetical protein
MNTAQPAEYLQDAVHLQKKGWSLDEIKNHLLKNGTPENILQEVITQLKFLRDARKRKSGFICCGIGVGLLVIGCMFTLMLYGSGNSMRIALYGLTTLGVIVLLKGLADLMGW